MCGLKHLCVEHPDLWAEAFPTGFFLVYVNITSRERGLVDGTSSDDLASKRR